MSRFHLLALLMGLLLVAAPFTKNSAFAEEEYDDDEDEAPKEADDDEKDVVVLTSGNFDNLIKNHKYVLAEFYAPWCGHCKTLKPHYAAAATALKEYNPDIVIGKCDATVETELASKFQVQGYPTIKWFVNGEMVSDYNGGRDTEGIIKWIKKKTGPSCVTVADADKLAALEKESPVIVLGYFDKLEGADYETFKAFTEKSEDATFAETTDAAVAKAAGLEKPGIVAIKNFKGEDRETVALSGDLTADSLKAFVLGEKLSLTMEFNQDNSDKIFNSGIPKQLILWSKADDFKEGSKVWAAYFAVAKKLKGKLVFVTVNNEGESHEPVSNYFGLKDTASPVIIGFHMEKNKKYHMTTDPTDAAAMEEFANSVLDGTATPDYKSAPIPEDNKDADVTIVVGKTVESIVKDTTKDVLLEVYAPWCGHCKQLDPIYKKLAKRFKKVDSVVIAKMDGTENEHPDVEVKGFPTIYFFPAGEEQKPIAFEGGDRSLKALTKFIKKHAKVPYTLPKKGSDAADEGASTDADKPEQPKDEL